MLRHSRSRRTVPAFAATALAAALLGACVTDDPVAPPAPGATDPPAATSPAPAPESSAEPEGPGEQTDPTAGSGAPRADDPETTSVEEVQWTAWELERRAVPPPEPPAEFFQGDQEGAIAAGTHVLAVVEHLYNTLVPDTWSALSSPECSYCQGRVDSTTTWSIEGTYDEDMVIDLQAIDANQEGDGGWWTIEIDAHEQERTIVDSVGGLVEVLVPSDFVLILEMSWDGSTWVIEEGNHRYV